MSDTLTIGMNQSVPRAVAYLSRTTAYYSLRTEAYAKGKAPWTDRTGNARSGLTATYSAEQQGQGATFTIDLFHRVPYGIWLEVRYRGKWGIINRSIEDQGRAFFNAANQVMARMFGGS